jgi:hypothetical protein
MRAEPLGLLHEISEKRRRDAGVFLFCAQISERALIVARDECTYDGGVSEFVRGVR